jgi:AbrB family looped-hinge helix DNA binding protein
MAMRVTSKGQVTIPVEIREKLGLVPNSEVEFEIVGNAVRLRKVRSKRAVGRGRSLVARLRGKGSVRMSTDEILRHTRGGR